MSTFPDLQEATIRQLQDGLSAGLFTSTDLVKAYMSRINEVNSVLNAVISISPAAFDAARRLDKERQAGQVRSVLHGIPITLKDCIATRMEDGMDTTAGSFALQGAIMPEDADCVALLREAGAIILCKDNLSEWGFFRGVSAGGWSPVGGQTTSPYYPFGHPGGSSSGTGASIAVGLAAAGIGEDTGGSIIGPSSSCALVGLRPTVGLVSQKGGVPISPERDTFGPMCRTVYDAAIMLEVISGRPGGYTRDLDKSKRLDGVRLLVPTNLTDWKSELLQAEQKVIFESACQTLKDLGADLVQTAVSGECVELDRDREIRLRVWEPQFVQEIEKYLASLKYVPSGVQNLRDLIRYTKEDPRESPAFYDSCSTFESALSRPGLKSPSYLDAKARLDRSRELIDVELRKHSAHGIVVLSAGSKLLGHAGLPQVTVPLGFLSESVPIVPAVVTNRMGETRDAPLRLLQTHPNQAYGINFASLPGSEALLLRIAHAFEQATQVRSKGRTYAKATPRTQLADIVSFPCT